MKVTILPTGKVHTCRYTFAGYSIWQTASEGLDVGSLRARKEVIQQPLTMLLACGVQIASPADLKVEWMQSLLHECEHFKQRQRSTRVQRHASPLQISTNSTSNIVTNSATGYGVIDGYESFGGDTCMLGLEEVLQFGEDDTDMQGFEDLLGSSQAGAVMAGFE